jgi:flagellar protein FlaG
MIVDSTTPVGPAPAAGGRQEIAAPGGQALPAAAKAAALAADQQRLQQHFAAFIAQHDQEAHFVLDKNTGLTIVRIVNRTSGELVRQIPTEEVVRIAQYLDAQNAFLDVTA